MNIGSKMPYKVTECIENFHFSNLTMAYSHATIYTATPLPIHGNLFAVPKLPPLRSQTVHNEAIILPNFVKLGF